MYLRKVACYVSRNYTVFQQRARYRRVVRYVYKESDDDDVKFCGIQIDTLQLYEQC